jgi:hypothetical protein
LEIADCRVDIAGGIGHGAKGRLYNEDWSDGVVEWWSGGVVEWWSGGVLLIVGAAFRRD